MACPCGCTDLVKIGEDRSERLDIIFATPPHGKPVPLTWPPPSFP